MKKHFLVALSTVLLLISIAGCVMALRYSGEEPPQFVPTLSVEILGEKGRDALVLLPGADMRQGFSMTVNNSGAGCWLFAKLEFSDNFYDYLSYQIADGWTPYPGEDDLYYRFVSGEESGTTFDIFTNDSLHALDCLTAEDLAELERSGAFPECLCHAYIAMAGNFSAEQAWEFLSK